MNIINKVKELVRTKLTDVNLIRGDTIVIEYSPNGQDLSQVGFRETMEGAFGKPVNGKYQIQSYTLTDKEAMVFNEAIMFSGEFEDRKALGSMILEKK